MSFSKSYADAMVRNHHLATLTAIPENFEMAPRILEELAANDAAIPICSRNCCLSILRYPLQQMG
jgi:hypothetical protein